MTAPGPLGRRAALAGLALAAAPAACARPPEAPRPFGHLPLRPERLEPLPLPALPALRAPGPLVVRRFDDAAAQPVGGAYDGPGARDGLARQTYAFGHAALELSEHFCDALRGAGLDARLAYAATPAGGAGARAGGELLAWQHDVVRVGRGPDDFVYVARARLRLEASGAPGAPPFARTWSLAGKAAPGAGGADVLPRFGRWAAALAASDPAFLAAVGAFRP